MFDHVQRFQATGTGGKEIDHAGGKIKGVHVLAKGRFDARAQHLDRDRFTGFAQGRLVHLRNGCGGHWFAEVGKDRVDRLAQLFFNFALGHGDVKGRQLVLQNAQLHGQVVAHHIGAR